MIVYGDPQFKAATGDALLWLREQLIRVQAGGFEALRTALIQAGQLEQAVADSALVCAEAGGAHLAQCQRLTDLLAQAVVAWLADSQPQSIPAARAIVDRELARPQVRWLSADLTLKVPEGFEFYALFPEQFREAALAWLEAPSSRPRRPVLVVGIRGIGTTLSAIVAATLKSAGWPVERLTVRPVGHPFARKVELKANRRGRLALIVDEGPGISGSSMAAAANALVERGFRRADISFLPGHRGLPGPAASEDVRRWWTSTPRYTSGSDQLRWHGLDLPACLKRVTESFPGCHGPVQRIQDLSAGGWRAVACPQPAEWPPAMVRFERLKFLCSGADGGRVLWRFTGLGAWVSPATTALENAQARLSKLSREGFAPPPLGFAHGFVAQPWIEGARLCVAGAADDAVLNRAAAYLVSAAGPGLSPTAHQSACRQLEEMARQNLMESFGNSAGDRVRQTALVVRDEGAPATYGDGRLAPHEWVRTSDGRLMKTDCTGHEADHTIVGRQSVLWDVAGFRVEWGLDQAARERWLAAAERAGLRVNRTALCFYELAYAAYRLGMASLCLDLEPAGSPERSRLKGARQRYEQVARTLLSG